jgi:uncharacterized protein YjbI with pentapeptide repeats
MAKKAHLQKLKNGAKFWNDWRSDEPDVRPDLSGAGLSGVNLSKYNLDQTDLSGARLANADLSEAIITFANLAEADLEGARLFRAEVWRSDLRKANLNGALIERADLSYADFRGARLSGATAWGSVFDGADLSGAQLLQTNFQGSRFYQAKLIQVEAWRVDFLAADLTGSDLTFSILDEATFTKANLTDAVLIDTSLEHANLVDTVVKGADFSHSSVYGASVWNLQGVPKAATNLSITPRNEPKITVDDLEIAQFIYLLLNSAKLRNVVNAVTEKGVLLLGRFSDGGLERLNAIAQGLRDHPNQYLPIVFDFERPTDRNYTETVKSLVGLSRFVIVDLSGPSVPQELTATIPYFKIPFVPILEAGTKAYSMFADLLEYPWVISPPVEFTDTEALLKVLGPRIVKPAEAWVAARRKKLAGLHVRSRPA